MRQAVFIAILILLTMPLLAIEVTEHYDEFTDTSSKATSFEFDKVFFGFEASESAAMFQTMTWADNATDYDRLMLLVDDERFTLSPEWRDIDFGEQLTFYIVQWDVPDTFWDSLESADSVRYSMRGRSSDWLEGEWTTEQIEAVQEVISQKQ